MADYVTIFQGQRSRIEKLGRATLGAIVVKSAPLNLDVEPWSVP
jgi:hypothetical protein